MLFSIKRCLNIMIKEISYKQWVNKIVPEWGDMLFVTSEGVESKFSIFQRCFIKTPFFLKKIKIKILKTLLLS